MFLNTFVRIAGSLVSVLVLASGCIPSKSEVPPKEETKIPAITAPEPAPPKLVPSSEVADSTADKNEDVKNSKLAVSLAEISSQNILDPNDLEANIQKMEEMSMNQGGVMMYSEEGGVGYKLKGAYGLTATLKPDELGTHWIFKGEFAQTAEGFKVGEPQINSITNGLPFQTTEAMPGVVMITIPVNLPDINAIETGETYITPIEFTIEADKLSTFVISLMPLKNL
jgi:hypothetical protein